MLPASLQYEVAGGMNSHQLKAIHGLVLRFVLGFPSTQLYLKVEPLTSWLLSSSWVSDH